MIPDESQIVLLICLALIFVYIDEKKPLLSFVRFKIAATMESYSVLKIVADTETNTLPDHDRNKTTN